MDLPDPAMNSSRYLAVIATATLLGIVACGGPPAPDGGVPDRETFIAAWADLRIAASQRPGLPITAQDRDRILTQHGVTEEGLLRFVEVHAADPTFMFAVVTDLRTRIQGGGSAAPQTEPG